jgi:translation machinery-associated protein 16
MFSCRTCVSLAIPADSDSYIQRDDDELATLKAQRRKGRPPSADEERLTQMIDSELERWSGDWAGMNSLKFVRVVETGAIRPSSFPPKGQS